MEYMTFELENLVCSKKEVKEYMTFIAVNLLKEHKQVILYSSTESFLRPANFPLPSELQKIVKWDFRNRAPLCTFCQISIPPFRPHPVNSPKNESGTKQRSVIISRISTWYPSAWGMESWNGVFHLKRPPTIKVDSTFLKFHSLTITVKPPK